MTEQGQGIDSEMGEDVATEAEEDLESQAPDNELEQIADATAAKLLKGAPLTIEEINKRRETGPGMPVGIMGWFAKVGQTTKGKGDKAKIVPGARIVGQIVGVIATKGKFGLQQAVIVFGKYVCPAYLNTQRQMVPAIDKIGRWMVGIDSTLTELPGHVGAVVDIEFKKNGGRGTGQRHTYERVTVW